MLLITSNIIIYLSLFSFKSSTKKGLSFFDVYLMRRKVHYHDQRIYGSSIYPFINHVHEKATKTFTADFPFLLFLCSAHQNLSTKSLKKLSL